MQKLTELKARTLDIRNLRYAASVLGWDQQTQMPKGGTKARASQLATLSKVAHEMFVNDGIGELIEAAEQEVQHFDPESDDYRLVQVIKRDYHRATKLPSTFVAEFSRQTTLAHEIWAKARQDNDFEHFRPILETLVDLVRQKAEYLGYEEHPYDALIDEFEPGAKTSQVATVFSQLREELVPLVHAILEKQSINSDEPLRRHFPIEKQEAFGLKVVQQMGYDMARGRQDIAVHPFCISFSCDDVRITTRFDANFLQPALFGTIHESGHAMYEQGVNPAYEGTFLSKGTSLGVHESQSRLWENMVGRSRGFWQHYYPSLQETFDGVLDDVDLETFYRAINYVSPSFIRVEADEVTYPLHIMLRFEIEQDILSGQLTVKEAPAAWNDKFKSYFGAVPPTDTLGLLQDVHWSSGLMGYFATYLLGTLLSAQLYHHARQAHPQIPDEIQHGQFATLLQWMRTHIHQHGRKYLPDELIQKATGEPLSHRYFMDYLRQKYGEIYAL